MAQQGLQLRVPSTQKLFTLRLTSSGLHVGSTDTRGDTSIPLRQVISATCDAQTLEVSYIGRKKETEAMSLRKLVGVAVDTGADAVAAWAETLEEMAYEGVKRGRRLKILINPHSGTRKAVATFMQTVEPVLRSAKCLLDVILLNGFAHHAQPINALRTPIAPIPAGTGNGLSLNILGLAVAQLICAGQPMAVDVCSLVQEGKRTISFMSQAVGLMADLDIGTDNLRWMGEARFMYGFLRGVAQFKPCPVQLLYKAAEVDKVKMADALQQRRDSTQELQRGPDSDDTSLPPLKYFSPDDGDGWTTLDKPLMYVYAGKGPYVGRDLMAFPVSLPDDGLVDIVAQHMSSRSDMLSSAGGGAAKGESYWKPSIQYIKAYAYRVKPLSQKGSLSVDGEVFPFKEYYVEAHQGLATLLSPLGRYAAEFTCKNPHK
ncbi:ATP-NAD kinase-like domain-containing protein [Mycena rebaudengoi]|nr:ATP-NAD kinase-like domain-containing protein [Mycena rebaudengoi]